MIGAISMAEYPLRLHVAPVLFIKATAHSDDADDLVSGFRHKAGRVRTDVAEALHDDTGSIAIQPQFLDRLFADHENAAPSSFTASARSTDVDRLAGDDRGAGLPHVHGVGIHN